MVKISARVNDKDMFLSLTKRINKFISVHYSSIIQNYFATLDMFFSIFTAAIVAIIITDVFA